MARVQVIGGARLRRTLRQAGVDMKQLRDANRQAAASILPIAVGMAPVGQTLRLKGSLRTAATNRAGILRAGRKSVPYAGVVHWGNPHRGTRAQPWIMRAAQDNEAVWMKVYMEKIDDVLNSIEGM